MKKPSTRVGLVVEVLIVEVLIVDTFGSKWATAQALCADAFGACVVAPWRASKPGWTYSDIQGGESRLKSL
jgi:hypothetical protein